MASIRGRKLKESSGGYTRLFGNPDLGMLVSKVQSTVISSGTELEKMIISRVQPIDDLDSFLQQEIMPEGVFIAPKKQIKECTTLKFSQGEPDFLIFKRRDSQQNCYVVELKDGHVFDTKKASAESRLIHSFVERNAQHFQYPVRCYFCAFNQTDRANIVQGFKNKIALDEAITGEEFCDLLELDYQEIVQERKKDQTDNVQYFLSELVKIEQVRRILTNLLKNGND